jgi:hypothetical protein
LENICISGTDPFDADPFDRPARLLLNFLTQKNGRPASQQRLEDLDAPVILQFLDDL